MLLLLRLKLRKSLKKVGEGKAKLFLHLVVDVYAGQSIKRGIAGLGLLERPAVPVAPLLVLAHLFAQELLTHERQRTEHLVAVEFLQ